MIVATSNAALVCALGLLAAFGLSRYRISGGENVFFWLITNRMAPPAVIVVGAVVDLRETLSWFETKPLFGWRVLVPRTKDQAGPLVARLRGYGAVPDEVPTISVEPPRNPLQMDKAVRGLVEGRYEWIAFTSVNAVRAVREKFEEYGLDARAFSGLKIAAVGDKTAEAIAAWGLRADLVPSGEQSAAGLLEEWPPYDEVLDPINRVFLPRADIATENLVAGLIDLGWECDDVTAYRTVRAAPPPAPTREAIKTGKFDAVVFTSSSTVRNLVGIAGKPHARTIVACIGPQTAETAREFGLRVDVQPEEARVPALVDALDLKRPIYATTAAYGHFGRELPEFTWERTDRAEALICSICDDDADSERSSTAAMAPSPCSAETSNRATSAAASSTSAASAGETSSRRSAILAGTADR